MADKKSYCRTLNQDEYWIFVNILYTVNAHNTDNVFKEKSNEYYYNECLTNQRT